MNGDFHDPVRWLDRLGGAVIGLGLGLLWSSVVTIRLVRLGARMGTEVLRAGKLSAHVSREYQNIKLRVERIERILTQPLQDDIERERYAGIEHRRPKDEE
jgi:hypothetical protein